MSVRNKGQKKLVETVSRLRRQTTELVYKMNKLEDRSNYEAFDSKEHLQVRSLVQAFTLQGVYADHLICYPLDNQMGETAIDVAIAKPWKLRLTPFDGLTDAYGYYYSYENYYTRVVDNGLSGEDNKTERQVVIPEYYTSLLGGIAQDLIIAIYVGSGTDLYIDSEPIFWQDLNVDGRAWAKAQNQDDL